MNSIDTAQMAVESQQVPNSPMLDYANARKVSALTAARAVHPFTAIEPVPRSRLVVATANNWVESIPLPGDATYLYFTAPGGFPFFVSFAGGIVFPITADPNNQNRADPLVSPIGRNFFCRGLNSITVAIPDAGVVIGVGIV